MPKNDRLYQSEMGVPMDAGVGHKYLERGTEYPQLISHVEKKGEERMGDVQGPAQALRENYDEQHGGEDNLHTQYVRENFFEFPSTQKFGK